MNINILTIFPDFFSITLNTSILKRAQQSAVKYNVINIREFTTDKHQTTDDRPFGGGAGMVMKVEPIDKALQSLGDQGKKGQIKSKIILTSAQGNIWDQSEAQKNTNLEALTIICGHYDGVDQRVIDNLIDEEIRIGDYILSGGESAALVMIDSIVRLFPGVLGNEGSLEQETNMLIGQKDAPIYTQPREYRQWSVPEILLSGDHKKISNWRQQQNKVSQ